MKSSKVLNVCFLSEFIRVERSFTIKCSNCGAKLVEGAKFCDICGHPCASPEQQAFIRKTERARKRRIIIAVCIVLLLIGGVFGANIFFKSYTNRLISEGSLSDVKATVSVEEYEKIKLRMTQDEVEKIIGGKGKVTRENDFKIEYSWPGEYYVDGMYSGFCLSAEFDKETGLLDEIEEDNIVLGESSRKYYDLIINGEASKLDAPTVTKKQLKRLEKGMSPAKVASILGGEGVKTSQTTTTRTYLGDDPSEVTTTVITNYTWKCILTKDDSVMTADLTFFDDELEFLPDNFFYSIIK